MVDYVLMGRRMKMKRRSKHLSQEYIANEVHISPSFYGNIERGIRIPSVDTLVAIANALEVGTDYLLAESLTVAFTQYSPQEMRFLSRYLRDQVEEIQYDSAMFEQEEGLPDPEEEPAPGAMDSSIQPGPAPSVEDASPGEALENP